MSLFYKFGKISRFMSDFFYHFQLGEELSSQCDPVMILFRFVMMGSGFKIRFNSINAFFSLV